MNPPSLPPAAPQSPPGPRTGLAIASLVLGILALPSSLVVVGALFGLIGVIFGIAHLLRRQGRNGMAWTGLVLSIIGILVGAGMGVLSYKVVKSPQFQATFQKALATATANRGAPPVVESDEFGDWLGVVAPDFSVTTLDDQTIKLSDLKGKRVVLDFWATWCPPCVQEIPHFIKLRNEASEDDLVIVGISSEDAATLKSFVKKKGINYPIASADDLPAPYKNVSGIPTTFFIDRKGIIQNVFVGYHEFDVLKKHALAEDFAGEPKSIPTAPVSGLAEAGKVLHEVELWSQKIGGAQTLCLGDWDGDGTTDILVGTGKKLHVLGADGAEKTSLQLPESFAVIECGRHKERGARLLGYSTWGRKVSVMDQTGKELWSYPAPLGLDGAHWGDLDGDGTDELVAGMNGSGGLHAVSADGKKLWAVSSLGNVWNQAVIPAGANGSALVFATEAGGTVRVFDANGSPLRTIRPLGKYCAQMSAAVMDQTGTVQAIAIGQTWAIAFDANGSVAWSTPSINKSGVGENTTFACGDINGDGVKDWAFLEASGDLVLVSSAGEKIAALPNATGLAAFVIAPVFSGKNRLVTLGSGTVRAYTFE